MQQNLILRFVKILKTVQASDSAAVDSLFITVELLAVLTILEMKLVLGGLSNFIRGCHYGGHHLHQDSFGFVSCGDPIHRPNLAATADCP